jgi:hypothetical protein
MNLKLILSLASVSVLIGAATSFGFTQGLEWFFWIVLAIFSAYLIGKQAPQRPAGHGFTVGMLSGLLSSATESLFFDLYITNNPESADRLARIARGIDPRLFILLSGAIIGLAAGIVFAVLSLLAARIETGRLRPSPPKH